MCYFSDNLSLFTAFAFLKFIQNAPDLRKRRNAIDYTDSQSHTTKAIVVAINVFCVLNQTQEIVEKLKIL